jgi:hypothetical protein
MVDWNFLFEAMMRLGFPSEFVDMLKILFQDAEACVKVNGSVSDSFRIERGVRQGYPIAPYLFLIAVEVLNRMVTAKVGTGRVKSILLPVEGRQLFIM